MNENELSKIIVDSCYKIHTQLGPGLLENVYEKIKLVNSVLNKYDLLNPEEMLQCEFNIIEELNMGSNWVVSEDVEKLGKLVARAQADQRS